jgi:hypothetical protein
MKSKLPHSLITAIACLASGLLSAQAYFQQEVNYTIAVTLNDVKHELQATEKIEYINNSPATLSVIYMHLWPNAYKDNSTPLAKQMLENGETKLYHSTREERGYIDQIDFKVNDQAVKWELLKDSIDICKIYLNEPLQSGNKINITTPFHVKIPSGKISRLGHVGQSYQITQWYPKPAVYDRNGWNYMPYLNQGEFYSEFGSFDVSITLPKNYVLGATGDLVNGEQETEWLNQKAKETESITSFDKKDMAFPASAGETKTLEFRQHNVHDFAWFCDKRYHVLKGEIETPHTKHKVTTWAFFTNAEGDLWKKSISYINDAIYYYSLWNGDYPYNHCTAVDGTISAGTGMEYPNITVIGTSNSPVQLDIVITHEVGHNWFYGMLGSNERIHPWMDEGINSFNELRYVEIKYPDSKLFGPFANRKIGTLLDLKRYKQKSQYYLTYILSAATHSDQPIEAPAYEYTDFNYGGIIYGKTPAAFDYLMSYIGEKKMDEAMQKYFDEWHFKHPQPNDLRKILEEVSGKDLRWFFDDLMNTTKKLDYKIAFAHKNANGSWDLGIKNTGKINGPVFIHGIKNKTLVGELNYDGFPGKQVLSFPAADVDYFKIDFTETMPELNRKNNTIRTEGIFKTVEPVKLQFLGSLNNPTKTQLFWTPVAGWNDYNKWMLGVALYNAVLPRKKFEFEIMPMYSHATKDLTGYAHLAHTFYCDESLFHHIQLGLTGARYATSNDPLRMDFDKIAPELKIEFRKKSQRSPYTNTLRYRNISIFQDGVHTRNEMNVLHYSRITYYDNYNDLTYTLSKKDAIQPYAVNVNVQQGEEMAKASLTANYTYNFKKKNKGLDIRLFAGAFLDDYNAGPYRFRLSGQRGYQDYLYDHVYLGRMETEGILANQFTETDGGFKFYSAVGQTAKWITALNVKSSLGNLKLPLCLYADIGMTADDGRLDKKIINYDAGVCLSLKKNVFEVYFPLLISENFQTYKDANDISYEETIRFTLNLNLINPFDLIRNFSF